MPGPPQPRHLLWAFTDARDAAQAFRLAAENEIIEHEVFIISGYDTCSKEKTRDLLARNLPDVPLKGPIKGHDTLWSYIKAQEMLGYQPRHSWR